MNGAGWFVLGALFMAVLIYAGSWVIELRQRRRDRHNVETMAKIKERMFNDPFPFGIPITESDLVPDDKIYVVNPDYLYFDGKPVDPVEHDIATLEEQVAMIMSKRTKARIKNIGES